MRKVKFRAWNNVLNKMYSWNEFLNTNMEQTFIAPESTAMILMQYTGLHDENGTEIYEGDIVRDMEVYLTHQSYVKQEIESVQEAEKYRYFGNVAVVEFCTQEIASCGCCYQEFVGTGFKAKRVDLTCCEVIRKYI